jgi:hypothetical protein
VAGSVRRRYLFFTETVLAVLTGVLGLVTAIWRDWIEIVFGVEPDQGSGALEWGLVAALFAVSAVCGLLARAEWRRPAAT